jgi:hypothetical protein
MNFKLKALVAAVALVGAVGQASAAVSAGIDGINSPNGELVFYAFGADNTGKVATYVKDLGVAFNSFATTPSFSAINVATGDNNWSSFASAGLTNIQWGVFATQATSGTPTAANTWKILTTANGNNAVVQKNSVGVGGYSNINNAIAALNGIDTNYAANTSYYFAPAAVDQATQSGNFGTYLGSDLGSSGVFFNTTNAVGTTAAFFSVNRGIGNNTKVDTVSNLDGTKVWSFNANNELSYVAAVPEPESYAMMVAGLLMLGAVARRRRA